MSAGGGFTPAWGATPLGPSRARFRVWAPGTDALSLRLHGRDLPMPRDREGWFALDAAAEPGAPYLFVLPDGLAVPDPASRRQQGDVHGPSLLTDPASYAWKNQGWPGRPWEEAVVYELHVGTFTPEGTFAAAARRLDHLAQVGVTAVELMPVAQFGGARGWGYDGVLLYAPHGAYGTPDDMKAFVDAAHGQGLMVLLDVVYNHFGPDGNFLPRLAPAFFHPERRTPWGGAIAYEKASVRRFFIDNALYWLDEFRLDGLRLDAVDHIHDPADPELLVELAGEVRARFRDRPVHLTTEDNRNITRLHERGDDGRVLLHTAEWNDDLHNAAHVLASGETEGYYEDFSADPLKLLGRALAEGFSFQGEPSVHAGGTPRGEKSAHLPPAAFVDFLQNHDQIGNRAFGERLISLTDGDTLRALSAILLLSPHVPLLFMGEEWGETNPFFFFTDFHGDLAKAVREGRRNEFAKFAAFVGERREDIPDPNAEKTFEASKLDWAKPESAEGRAWLEWTRALLALRGEHVVPALKEAGGHAGKLLRAEEGLLAVDWTLGPALLELRAGFGPALRALPPVRGEAIFRFPADLSGREHAGPSVLVSIGPAPAGGFLA